MTAAERLVQLAGRTGTAAALLLAIGTGATAGEALVNYSGLPSGTAAQHLLWEHASLPSYQIEPVTVVSRYADDTVVVLLSTPIVYDRYILSEALIPLIFDTCEVSVIANSASHRHTWQSTSVALDDPAIYTSNVKFTEIVRYGDT